jgi:uncharacterized membrane protein YheB (UPF0754 family)
VKLNNNSPTAKLIDQFIKAHIAREHAVDIIYHQHIFDLIDKVKEEISALKRELSFKGLIDKLLDNKEEYMEELKDLKDYRKEEVAEFAVMISALICSMESPPDQTLD